MSSTESSQTLEELQAEWKEMFQKTLPQAATTKSEAQVKWPVHVDHCFARIILDKIVGIDSPWMTKLKSPAYKNMSESQLRDSIDLGREILAGEADLVVLNNESLEIRGKAKGMARGENRSGKMEVTRNAGKRKREVAEGEGDATMKTRKISHVISPFFSQNQEETATETPGTDASLDETPHDLTVHLKKIALSHKTPFQKRVLSLLCQVPRGRYTTYGAISAALKSSPRAVGNALRENPFAPMVPCHRVLASDGGIGGFGGSWGRKGVQGLNDGKKRDLLREEGVRFDGRGRAVGNVWEGFR